MSRMRAALFLSPQMGNSGGTGISLYFLLVGRTSQIVSVVPLEK